MNNTILKSLSVENFTSFADRITLQQRQTLVKKNFLITHSKVDMMFNKVSFLYGANGTERLSSVKS